MIRIYGRYYPLPTHLMTCTHCKSGTLTWQEETQTRRDATDTRPAQDAKRGKAWVCNAVKTRQKIELDGSTVTLRDACEHSQSLTAIFDDDGLDEKLRLGVDVSRLRMTPFALRLALDGFRKKYRLFEWIDTPEDARDRLRLYGEAARERREFAQMNHLMRELPAPQRLPRLPETD